MYQVGLSILWLKQSGMETAILEKQKLEQTGYESKR